MKCEWNTYVGIKIIEKITTSAAEKVLLHIQQKYHPNATT